MIFRELHWKFKEHEFTIQIANDRDAGCIISDTNETRFIVKEQTNTEGYFEIDDIPHHFFLHRNGPEVNIWVNGETYRLEQIEKEHAVTQNDQLTGEIRATMPGKIVRIDVSEGDLVEREQPLLIMESMKMESTLHSPLAGRVTEVNCSPEEVVEMNTLLLLVEN